jgi:hypothetical protein
VPSLLGVRTTIVREAPGVSRGVPSKETGVDHEVIEPPPAGTVYEVVELSVACAITSGWPVEPGKHGPGDEPAGGEVVPSVTSALATPEKTNNSSAAANTAPAKAPLRI